MEIISSGIVAVPSGVSSTGLYVIQEGVLEVQNNGWAQDVCLAEGGRAVVSNGGILYLGTVSSGGTATVLNSGYAQGITVSNGGLYLVSSGGTAHQSLIQSGGTQIVYADVMAASANVLDGGVLEASSGAYVRVPVVSQGGVLHVWNGAMVDRAQIFGLVEVNADAAARSASVLDGGKLAVLSDGYAYETKISSGGSLDVSSGGMAIYAAVYEGGAVMVSAGAGSLYATLNGGRITLAGAIAPADPEGEIIPGGFASNTTVNASGTLDVYSGATATKVTENGGYVYVADGATVTFTPNAVSGLVLSNASATVHAGTTATDTTVNSNGKLEVFSGGMASGVTENGGYVYVADGATVTFTPNAVSGLVLSNASATVHAGTTATDTTVNSNGKLEFFSGGKATGQMSFEDGAVVSAYEGAILDFDISGLTPEAGARVNNLSIIQGTPVYTLTVSAEQAKGIYTLAEGAAEFNGTLTVQNVSGDALGTLAAGETLSVGETDYTLNLNEASLTLTIKEEEPVPAIPENLIGTKDRVSWDPAGAGGYVVEYSTDNFAHGLQVDTKGNAVDMLALPAGKYQWRVKFADGDQWADGNGIASDNTPEPAKVLRSNADGSGDLFFASASGTWSSLYFAQHAGSVNDWGGTNELVSANGKNRIADLFFGSDDANILCLTDDENGDGIFVDDEYTELPEGIAEQQARIARIDEIRAGAGDDIVDMTSNRIEYTGDGLTIRGGDGNDVIWANKGDNMLFGDAGNDRIVGASGNDVIAGGIGNDRLYGGGGADTFVFCENFGADTVQQLESGSVLLWFASGSLENWDAGTLTYTDGENSVTVSGVAADRITLRFGDDDSAQYDTLVSAGAFLGFTSEKIFEENDPGILA